MIWYAFIVACFTNYCTNVEWLEKFNSQTECNETLPYIHAEITSIVLKIKTIDCRQKGTIDDEG